MRAYTVKRLIPLIGLLLFTLATELAAVELARDGTGEVLIFPYYSVEKGYLSLMTIKNTTADVKALKFRILEASNHREVLTFNIYLAPLDSWTAALFSFSDDGPGNIVTRDSSCTVPDIIGQTSVAPELPRLADGARYVSLRNYGYTGVNNDAGPDDMERNRQGMIEVIEMGRLQDDIQGSASAATFEGDAPADCEQLNQAWITDIFGLPTADSYWIDDANIDLLAPSGGLTGSMRLLNVPDGVQASYNPEIIDRFSQTVLHTLPGDPLPNLTSANHDSDGDGFTDSRVFHPVSGEELVSNWNESIDAVSALFMSETIENEIVMEDVLSAVTEWTLNYPTKQFYTDPMWASESRMPFSQLYRDLSQFPFFGPTPEAGSCQDYRFVLQNREGESVDPEAGLICIGACPPPILQVCHGSSTLAFDDQSVTSIFGERPYKNRLPRVFDTGHVRINLTPDAEERRLTDREGNIYFGVPVTGFSVEILKNNQSFGNGVIANYASSAPHRRVRRIESASEEMQ